MRIREDETGEQDEQRVISLAGGGKKPQQRVAK